MTTIHPTSPSFISSSLPNTCEKSGSDINLPKYYLFYYFNFIDGEISSQGRTRQPVTSLKGMHSPGRRLAKWATMDREIAGYCGKQFHFHQATLASLPPERLVTNTAASHLMSDLCEASQASDGCPWADGEQSYSYTRTTRQHGDRLFYILQKSTMHRLRWHSVLVVIGPVTLLPTQLLVASHTLQTSIVLVLSARELFR